MTASGRAACDEFDPLNHPANLSVSPGRPAIAIAPNLQARRFADAQFRITHGRYSTQRPIRLEAKASGGRQHSAVGFGSGWLEGDTLAIATTHPESALGGLNRVAQSSGARVVTERYRVLREGEAMPGQAVIEDFKALVRPIRSAVRLRRPENGAEGVPLPRPMEAARGHPDRWPAQRGAQPE